MDRYLDASDKIPGRDGSQERRAPRERWRVAKPNCLKVDMSAKNLNGALASVDMEANKTFPG